MAAKFPRVTENINGYDQNVDLVDRALQKKRTIYLNGEIDDFTALDIVTQLQYLDEKSHDDIVMYINSPGGSVTAGMAIYDVMKTGVKSDVAVVALGRAASMGAVLLAAGTKGKRYVAPGAEVMIHQPLGGVQGQATDIVLAAKHIEQVKQKLAAILAEECGKSVKKLLADMERDHTMTSEEVLAYGLVDKIGFYGMD
ncbi:MAG: ATP-dependent Clp protease proteolytic subunit [Firmicutes bacterium]|nr:ATP-dependent Clp protease proteolytic subunit [Bacillota bacterium]